MTLHLECTIKLPEWLDSFVDDWSGDLATPEQRMQLAVDLSAENVRHQTGGPFGAIVVEESSHHLVAVGVNLVTSLEMSIAHAEMVAISLAQARIGNWNLGEGASMQLVTSCEPCAMCFGAVPWSGVSSMIWGARKEDAEVAGFDEGDKPKNWTQSLKDRGIATHGDVLREQAAAVLLRYSSRSGAIYNPGSSSKRSPE